MHLRPLLFVAAALAALSPAAARADGDKLAAYPMAAIDRPLTLPRLVLQPFVLGSATSATVTDDSGNIASGLGGAVAFGLDAGLGARVQAGFFCVLPVAPVADFGAFVADLQIAAASGVNVRLDLGTQHLLRRYLVLGVPAADDSFGFVAGVGLPLKIRLSRHLAIVSGSDVARGWDAPPVVSGGPLLQFGDVLATQDLFSIGVWSLGGVAVISGSLHLPIGLLIQPHPIVSIVLRTGYRFGFTLWSGDSASNTSVHFIPVAVDLVFAAGRRIDVGLTGSLAGTVAGDSQRGWADVRKIDLWVAARF